MTATAVSLILTVLALNALTLLVFRVRQGVRHARHMATFKNYFRVWSFSS